MKIIRNIPLLFSLVTLLTGCEPLPANYVKIDVNKSVTCNYEAHIYDLKYNILPAADGTTDVYGLYAVCDDGWVEDVNCIDPGVMHITIAANEGAARSTKITLYGDNIRPTIISLNQMGVPSAVVDRTLIFHFYGTSLSRWFNTNIEDAKVAIGEGVLGANNRVVCIAQSSSTAGSIYELCYNPADSSVIKRDIDSFMLSSPHTTTEEIGEIISKAAQAAPANSYAMVLAGHGTGWITREILNNDGDIELLNCGGYNPWIPAIGAEVTRAFGESNIQFDASEIADAITHSGIELEYILFDACFMSNIEAIYDLRNSAQYIIASPCEIMGKGFPYHRTLPHLFGDNFDLESATESYYLYYRDEYSSSSRCGSIALFDCAEIEALADATRQVMLTATDDYNRNELQTYEGQKVHHFYDFGEWVNTVATDDTALATFNEQLARTVIAKFTLPTFYSAYGSYGTYDINEEVYSGVTTSAPSEAYPNGWKQTNWYKAIMQ